MKTLDRQELDVRKYDAEQALKKGMEAKSKEFVEKGARATCRYT